MWRCHLNLYPFSNTKAKPRIGSLKRIMRKFSKTEKLNVDTWTKSSDIVTLGTATCDAHASFGATSTGVYLLSLLCGIVAVYCEFERTTQGLVVWTHLQRRYDGSVDFYRNWNEYKRGFGSVSGEFWLGNDAIHELTKSGDQEVKFVMGSASQSSYAEYSNFQVDNEANQYQITISGYSGIAGDSMSHGSGMKFTTFDVDNDLRNPGNCAVRYECAWWNLNCFAACLNGRYVPGPLSEEDTAKGMVWMTWLGHRHSMDSSLIKIKSNT